MNNLESLEERIRERLYSGESLVSSVSTNSTDSSQVGPGRTLGLAYKYFGQKLEAGWKKIRDHKVSHDTGGVNGDSGTPVASASIGVVTVVDEPPEIPTVGPPLHNVDQHDFDKYGFFVKKDTTHEADDRSVFTSTNATASNLPGPGRTLDLFYQFLGRKLEVWLSEPLRRIGVGPIGVSRRIIRRSSDMRLMDSVSHSIAWNLRMYFLKNDCRKLLRYLR